MARSKPKPIKTGKVDSDEEIRKLLDEIGTELPNRSDSPEYIEIPTPEEISGYFNVFPVYLSQRLVLCVYSIAEKLINHPDTNESHIKAAYRYVQMLCLLVEDRETGMVYDSDNGLTLSDKDSFAREYAELKKDILTWFNETVESNSLNYGKYKTLEARHDSLLNRRLAVAWETPEKRSKHSPGATHRQDIEIDLDDFSNGPSKELLRDMLLQPKGVTYEPKRHGKKQPDGVKDILRSKKTEYEIAAKHIRQKKGKIYFDKKITVTLK